MNYSIHALQTKLDLAIDARARAYNDGTIETQAEYNGMSSAIVRAEMALDAKHAEHAEMDREQAEYNAEPANFACPTCAAHAGTAHEEGCPEAPTPEELNPYTQGRGETDGQYNERLSSYMRDECHPESKPADFKGGSF